jgi:hypothetical protein
VRSALGSVGGGHAVAVQAQSVKAN